MWDLPRPGLEPVSPALAGRFSTTAPPGKPLPCFCWDTSSFTHHCFCTISANASSVKKALNALVLLRKWFSLTDSQKGSWEFERAWEKKKSLASSFPKHFEAISYLLSQSHHYFLLNACVSHYTGSAGRAGTRLWIICRWISTVWCPEFS